jgi:hypothetical protein
MARLPADLSGRGVRTALERAGFVFTALRKILRRPKARGGRQMAISILEAWVEHARACGRICYKAFAAFAGAHNCQPAFPNAGVAIGVFGALMVHYSVFRSFRTKLSFPRKREPSKRVRAQKVFAA